MEIIIAIIICSISFVFGWIVRERYAVRQLEKLLGQVKAMKDDVKEDLVFITIEKHDNIFFVYLKENNQFVLQANTQEELEEKLLEKFPGKKFAVKQENLDEVGFEV